MIIGISVMTPLLIIFVLHDRKLQPPVHRSEIAFSLFSILSFIATTPNWEREDNQVLKCCRKDGERVFNIISAPEQLLTFIHTVLAFITQRMTIINYQCSGQNIFLNIILVRKLIFARIFEHKMLELVWKSCQWRVLTSFAPGNMSTALLLFEL